MGHNKAAEFNWIDPESFVMCMQYQKSAFIRPTTLYIAVLLCINGYVDDKWAITLHEKASSKLPVH
jgi:hypothetical protein